MKRKVLPGVAFVLASVVTCTGFPPFQKDSGSETADSGPDPGPEPLYNGDANDEAWRAMADAKDRAVVDSMKSSAFTVPTEGQTLPASAPATFTWTTPLVAMGPGPRPHRGGIGLFSTAHAHGTPVTGDIYWLFFTVPGLDEKITVLTTDGNWTPSDETWTQMKTAGVREIQVEIISAYLTENAVTDGPYKSAGVRRFKIN